MKKNLFFTLLSIAFLSCDKEDLNVVKGDISHLKSFKVGEIEARNISHNFIYSLSEYDDSSITFTKNSIQNSNPLPIEYEGEVIYWLFNFPENSGHVIISTDKRDFPIVRYSTESCLNYDAMSSQEKKTLISELKREYLRNINRSDNKLNSIWEELEKDGTIINDTTYAVEISFFMNFDVDTVPPDSVQTKVGSIPERDVPKGYNNIRPLLSLRNNRQWSSYWPYDYDMPRGYGGDPFAPGTTSSGGIQELPSLAVCFALVMDYYQWPRNVNWSAFPDRHSEATSTELTRFLKQLSYDLGYAYNIINSKLPANRLFTTVPEALPQYGFSAAGFKEYSFDQQIFNEIYNSLFYGNPVIYVSNVDSRYMGEDLKDCYVIDGAAEMEVRIRTIRYFAGQPIKKTYKWVYEDFFHYICPNATRYTWGKYDSKHTGFSYVKDYVFMTPFPLWWI